MKSKQLLALLLAALSAAAVSCGSAEPVQTADDTTEAPVSTEETTEAGPAELPERDLEGFEVHLSKLTQSKIAWATESFAIYEQNGDILNDAFYRRNVKLAEKYNFTLAETEFDDDLAQLRKQLLAGDTDYDLYMISINKVNTVASSENLIDFHTIPTLELNEDWWDQDIMHDLDNGSGIFFMNGDLVVTVYDNMRICYYNKNYAADLGLSGFYDLVRNGKWTIDLMYDMMKTAGRDVNQDAVYDYQDVFGLLYNNDTVSGLTTSMGCTLMDKEGNINVYNDKFASVYEKLVRQFNTGLTFNYNQDKYPNLTARQAIVTMFDNKQALFFENGLSAAAQYMREVQNCDYGFLPLPKYDEAQERYYAHISSSAPVLAVPVTIPADRLEKLGFALEALARESHESVIPEYYGTCFARKFTLDEESYEMLTMACDSVIYDIGQIYDYGKISTTITNLVRTGNESYVSSIDSIKEAVIDAYKKVNG